MFAARLHEIGGALHLDEIDPPAAAEGEVEVELAFAAVNPLDVWITQGSVGAAGANLPWTPGTEATGHLEGRPVLVRGSGLGLLRQGLYRQRASVPASAVSDLAAGLDLAQVAGIGVAGLTAWHAVHTRGQVDADDRVVVFGASGGVGSIAVQLARAAGAEVWGQTSSSAKAEGIGADHVIVAGEGPQLDGALADARPTVVLDSLGGAYTQAAVAGLEPRGRLVVYGTSAGEVVTVNLRTLYRKALTVLGYSGMIETPAEQAVTLGHLLDLLAAGQLRVPIDEILPLGDAAEAHRRILDREVRGKLILDCNVAGR